MQYKNRLTTEVYRIKHRHFNTNPSLNIAFLTDLHNCEYGENNQQLLDRIHLHNPDIVLCTGDMLVGKPDYPYDIPVKLMQELTKDYPVYYANGNHESRMSLYPEDYGNMYEDYMWELKRTGVKLLNNDHIVLREHKICLYGLDIIRCFYHRFRIHPMSVAYLNDSIGIPDSDYYNILLAHNPCYNEVYGAWGADLVLSGHYHGGLMRLPKVGGVISPQLRLFPKYCDGQYRWKNTDMIVSRGLGSHSLNIRINNPPELSVIILQGES